MVVDPQPRGGALLAARAGAARAAAADPARFERLFAEFGPALRGTARRVVGDTGEAEDVVQEAFAKLARDPVLDRPDAEVRAWLRRVVLNLGANRLRSRGRARVRLERVGRLERVDNDPGEASGGPLAVVLAEEERSAVRAALAELPPRQRACLLLRHAGYSYAEIAETLDLAVGSVGVLLARAERLFRRRYRRS